MPADRIGAGAAGGDSAEPGLSDAGVGGSGVGVVTADPGNGPSDRRIPARMIMLIGTMTALGPLCIDMYLPSLPVIGRQLEASPSAVQLSLTACLIGLALGQIVLGTVSDSVGRRRPLIGGLMLFVLASLACSLAPNIAFLVGLRFAQGFGGAAGIVVGRAIVRDTYSGHRLGRFFSLLVLVTGVGPLVAPQVGAALLHLGSWRFVFMLLAVLGAAIAALAAAHIPETLPVTRRTPARFAQTLGSMRRIATDRRFALVTLAGGLAVGALFAYVAGSAFVLETVYGLSPQGYSLTFTMNAVVLIAASQVSARLVRRVGAYRLLLAGVSVLAAASMCYLGLVLAGRPPLPAVLACFVAAVGSNGFIGPNSITIALTNFPRAAGTASALVGVTQFSFGALTAPLAGLGGEHDITPMATVMATCGGLAFVLAWLVRGQAATQRFDELAGPGVAAAGPGISAAEL
jgi:DHA1 family bicyclomycin/chloramphenicol resistance-like MFS transporter